MYTHTRQPSTSRRRHSDVGELTNWPQSPHMLMCVENINARAVMAMTLAWFLDENVCECAQCVWLCVVTCGVCQTSVYCFRIHFQYRYSTQSRRTTGIKSNTKRKNVQSIQLKASQEAIKDPSASVVSVKRPKINSGSSRLKAFCAITCDYLYTDTWLLLQRFTYLSLLMVYWLTKYAEREHHKHSHSLSYTWHSIGCK